MDHFSLLMDILVLENESFNAEFVNLDKNDMKVEHPTCRLTIWLNELFLLAYSEHARHFCKGVPTYTGHFCKRQLFPGKEPFFSSNSTKA